MKFPYNRQLPSLKISIQKDSIFYQSESIEQATGFTIQENMKALQTILGLKIAPKTALLSYRKTGSQKGFFEFSQNQCTLIGVDLVFPVLHGKNGEDGTLQGLFELAGIPIVGCNTLSSALCMDKSRAHKLVSLEGISVPKSVTFNRFEQENAIKEIALNLTYPLFVKPVRAGSSFGITKVTEKEKLSAAIALAFEHDTEVIVEEAIDGFEVGCAILGNDVLTVGRVDEIELLSGFFDYTEKYTLKTSQIHMPARIDAATEKKIQDTALRFTKLGLFRLCSCGFISICKRKYCF